MQWAWTSMVLTRLPLTTTSRRPCACGCPADPPPGPAAAPAVMSHPTKAMLADKSPLIGISIPVIDDPNVAAYYGSRAESRLFPEAVTRPLSQDYHQAPDKRASGHRDRLGGSGNAGSA